MKEQIYRLRTITMNPPLILAPMSGVTNSAFRRFVKHVNPGCVGGLISEFLSVEGMTRGSARTIEMMRFREEERPFGIQIFGYDTTRMADAARMVQDVGVDFVDINCGCPAPKVVKRGGGCELMRQPEHLKQIVREVRRAVTIPLTLKMRSGWDEESKNAREVAAIVEGEGVEAVTIHGRTRAQLYRGEADWQIVRDAAATLKIPVLGSGDVVDRASALERLTGNVAAVMVGRAALSNPLVFTEIMTGIKRNLRAEPLTVVSLIEKYIEFLREDFHDRACVGRVKQLVSQMVRGYDWRWAMCTATTLDDQCRVLAEVRKRYEDEGYENGDFPIAAASNQAAPC